MMKKLVLTALIVLATLTLAACAPRVRTTILSPEDGAAYAAEVDDIVENMLIGLNENDWAMFSRDAPPDVLATWEGQFPQIYDESIGVLGAYQSRTLDHVEAQGNQRNVFYQAVFENHPDVTIMVTFRIDDSINLVTGLGIQSE